MNITILSCLTSNCGIGRYTEQLTYGVHEKHENVKLFRKNEGTENFIHAFKHRSFKNLKHLVAPYYLKKAIHNTESEVWHADNIDAFSALIWSGKGNKKKKIVTIHDVIPLLYPHKHWWEKSAFKYHLSQAAKAADAIVTVSHTSKKDLVEKVNINPDKIKVVYNGINHDMLFPSIERKVHKRFNIRYIGGLGAIHKNAIALIETAKELKSRGFEFDMEIGSGVAHHTVLPELTKKYGLEKNIHFKGFVPDNQLQKFLSEADLFLYPSLYEGFGFPPLEAMACGTPVVSSNTGSLAEILPKGALLSKPEPTALADTILKIAQDKSLMVQLEKEAVENAKNFSWDDTVNQMLEIYRA